MACDPPRLPAREDGSQYCRRRWGVCIGRYGGRQTGTTGVPRHRLLDRHRTLCGQARRRRGAILGPQRCYGDEVHRAADADGWHAHPLQQSRHSQDRGREAAPDSDPYEPCLSGMVLVPGFVDASGFASHYHWYRYVEVKFDWIVGFISVPFRASWCWLMLGGIEVDNFMLIYMIT